MQHKLIPALLTVGVITLIAPPAGALEYGEPAGDSAEARTVAELKIGRVGNFGDCTGTLVAEQWVLTARHCLSSVNNEGTQARINGTIYDADSWALSPVSDAALLHLTTSVSGVNPAPIATDIPQPGQRGVIYGWSSSSSMARKGHLPKAEMEVSEILGGSPSSHVVEEGKQPDVPEGVESVPAAEAMPGAPAPESGDLGEGAMPPEGASLPDDSMPLIGSALLDVHSTGRAGVQGGDSGGPFFVDGKLAGLMTAGTSNGDPDLPSPSAAITTLSGAKEWIDGIVSGRDTDSILNAENSPEPPKVPQTSGDHVWLYVGIATIGLIAAAFIARIPGLRGRYR
ncbi:trypsin-like serine protease [Corynebacterium confusum]|uniref:trypsin-like serine protease n=1 Tax=Corynebacterium confusum TaxID=71254 RepID=UPI0025B573C1|nr:trypsin-like serine protease [Corynebacterium confusum]WJY90357.1 Trypsin [Corynebacterium confusum]